MVKKIVDKIKDAEARGEKLIKDAEANAESKVIEFEKERESRLKKVEAENESTRAKLLEEAEEKGKVEESNILSEAQKEMNQLRATADKKKKDAVKLVFKALGVGQV
jgi:vacuolar-type H+-ATPase subunit H